MLRAENDKEESRMQTQQNLSELQFVNLHVVDKNYHERHSQLLHKHEDVLELFYIMQGDGQYIVGGKEYIIRPGKSVSRRTCS